MSLLTLSPHDAADALKRRVAEATDGASQTRGDCGDCGRRLFLMGRGGRPRLIFRITPALPDQDFCRWCSRPTSGRANRLADGHARPATREP